VLSKEAMLKYLYQQLQIDAFFHPSFRSSALTASCALPLHWALLGKPGRRVPASKTPSHCWTCNPSISERSRMLNGLQ
jgi:hypothetical protein